MKSKPKMIGAAIQAVLMVTTISTAISSTSAVAADDKMEKCYGIAKAGGNDCATATESCASSAVKDAQPDAFIFLPTGLCERIVGGNLKPLKSNSQNSK